MGCQLTKRILCSGNAYKWPVLCMAVTVCLLGPTMALAMGSSPQGPTQGPVGQKKSPAINTQTPAEKALLKGKAAFADWPVRNFLPPVATINPKLDDIPEVTAADPTDNDGLEVVSLASVTTPVLTTKPAIERIDSHVDVLNDAAKAKQQAQADLEEVDMETLWSATVERNPVIRFSLEKLTTPEELAQKQSSVFMRKTLGVLISGATLASTMLPGGSAIGSYRNMGVMAGGDALKNLTSGRTTPLAARLTATEKIQLAGMIDDLQRQVIQAYHDYRRALVALADAHTKTTEASERYSLAMSQVNEASKSNKKSGNQQLLQSMQAALLMSNGASYYQSLRHETSLKQEAKRHRLQLERLAGIETVAGLKLAVGDDEIATVPEEITPQQATPSAPAAPTTAPEAPEIPEALLLEGDGA